MAASIIWPVLRMCGSTTSTPHHGAGYCAVAISGGVTYASLVQWLSGLRLDEYHGVSCGFVVREVRNNLAAWLTAGLPSYAPIVPRTALLGGAQVSARERPCTAQHGSPGQSALPTCRAILVPPPGLPSCRPYAGFRPRFVSNLSGAGMARLWINFFSFSFSQKETRSPNLETPSRE